jgi:hypothetical protein
MQFGTAELRRGAFGQPSVPFLLSRRAHLLTTPKGRWYCLRQPCALRGGCGSCGSLMDNATSRRCCCHCPRSYRKHTRFCVCEQGYKLYPILRQLPVKNINLMFFHCYGYRFCCDTHFLFAKKKQKQGRKDGENEWRSTTWRQRWSAEVRDDLRLLLPLI